MADAHMTDSVRSSLQNALNSRGNREAMLLNLTQAGDIALIIVEMLNEPNDVPLVRDILCLLNGDESLYNCLLESTNFSEAALVILNQQNIELLQPFLSIVRSICFSSASFLSYTNPEISRALLMKCLELIHSAKLDLSDLSCKVTEGVVLSDLSLLSFIVTKAQTCRDDSTVYLRFCAVISRILGASEKSFNACESSGAVKLLTDPLLRSEPDVLLQVVLMEILTDFANTKGGITFLFERGILDWLAQSADAASDPFLTFQALRQLGDILHRAHERSSIENTLWAGFSSKGLPHKFIQTTASHLERENEENRLAGLQAITAFACCNVESITMIAADQSLLATWTSLLIGKAEVHAATLQAFARVMEVEHSSMSSVTSAVAIEERVDAAKRTLFLAIGESRRMPTMTYLMKAVRQPVDPVRIAVLDLFRAVAVQPRGWGLQALSVSQEFCNYATDPETEFNKAGREWKFALLQAIALHPLGGMLDVVFFDKIKTLALKGPFYMPPRLGDIQTLEH